MNEWRPKAIREQVYFRCILLLLHVFESSLWLGLTVILYKDDITTNIRAHTVLLSPAYFCFYLSCLYSAPDCNAFFSDSAAHFFLSLHRLSECQCNFIVHKAAAAASEVGLMSLRLVGKEKMRKSLLVFTPGSMRDPPNVACRDDFWKKQRERKEKLH